MKFPGNVVTIEDTRSSNGDKGTPEKCFFCEGKTGSEHQEECAVLHRPVKVRLTIDMIVAAPRDFSEHSLNDFWNSDICLNSFIQDIFRYAGDEPGEGVCLCSAAKAEYLRESDLDEAIYHGLIPDSEEDGTPCPDQGCNEEEEIDCDEYYHVCKDCRDFEEAAAAISDSKPN